MKIYRAALIFVLSAICGFCLAGESHNWHLMSVTYGGKVSLISHLTKKEAEYMRARLLGYPATEEEKRAAAEAAKITNPVCPAKGEDSKKWHAAHPEAQGCHAADGKSGSAWGGGHAISDGDIKSVDVFE